MVVLCEIVYNLAYKNNYCLRLSFLIFYSFLCCHEDKLVINTVFNALSSIYSIILEKCNKDKC